jgi:hypothetical protein
MKRYIHARDVLAASHRPIEQFSFRNTLELIIQHCERAQGHPDHGLRYIGSSRLDGPSLETASDAADYGGATTFPCEPWRKPRMAQGLARHLGNPGDWVDQLLHEDLKWYNTRTRAFLIVRQRCGRGSLLISAGSRA